MEDGKLYEMAVKAKKYSYSPYSGYAVGAAVMTDSGNIYSGCNIENASYGATICAERNAIFKAISNGESRIVKIAIAGSTDEAAWPCGICRQVMSEFATDQFYVIVNDNGKMCTCSLNDLLPHSFTSDNMNK